MKKLNLLILVSLLCAGLGQAKQATTQYERALINAAKDGNASQVRGLLEAGTDPNVTDDKGNTPLIYAAKTNLVAVDMLLFAGADVNAKGNRGLTPLISSFMAISPDSYKIQQRLLKEKPDVNAVWNVADYRLGKPLGAVATALSYAVLNNDIEGAELLLKHGADINVRLDNLPLTTALFNKNSVKMVEYLLNSGANPCWYDYGRNFWNSRNHLGDEKELATKQALLQKAQAQIKTQCKLGEQLYSAVNKEDAKKVKKLLEKGADPNFYHLKLFLSKTKNIDIAKALIDAGANVNIKQGSLGQTPLFEADTVEKAELLVKSGADIQTRDYDGHNALYGSLFYDHQDVARWLMQKGLKLTAKEQKELLAGHKYYVNSMAEFEAKQAQNDSGNGLGQTLLQGAVNAAQDTLNYAIDKGKL